MANEKLFQWLIDDVVRKRLKESKVIKNEIKKLG